MDTSPKHPATRSVCQRMLPFLVLLTTLLSSTASHGTPLQEADNFEELAQLMREKKIPLLVALEASHCNFCARLKAEHLQPMNNNEGYTARILIRTLQMDGTGKITGFDGKETSPATLSKAYKAYLTPTMLFLNDKGEEVAKRILGYNSPGYFGFYLDQAIETAEKEISGTEK